MDKREGRIKRVKAKKHLGQHFLKDLSYAERLAEALVLPKDKAYRVAEVGPGTGALTQFLLRKNDIDLTVFEVDSESIDYLLAHNVVRSNQIEGDFLQSNLSQILGPSYAVVGNFPYNISSQIFFKLLEVPNEVDQVIGMLQKEVADRIVSTEGGRVRGILSVLIQAYYNAELLFDVPPEAFSPPPKVQSAVIKLVRSERAELGVDKKAFFRTVKAGFSQRRKTLRNAIKAINPSRIDLPLLDRRAETLSVDEFIQLTRLLEEAKTRE